MDNLAEATPPRRAKKACTECRQQKVRCNVAVDSGNPCPRCTRLKLECRVDYSFRREHKRQRLSELERETNDLRSKLNVNHFPGSIVSPAPTNETVPGFGSPSNASANSASLGTFQPTTASILPSGLVPLFNSIETSAERETTDDKTTARTIDGLHMDAKAIDGVFQIYFRDYHQFLPILDDRLTPNTIYAQSPLLFWAIVGVACRSYPTDPSLRNALPRKIVDLALMSLKSKESALPGVKAVILILTWPYAKTSITWDVNFPLAGSLLHLAMQIGLHVPVNSQDYSKVKLNLTESEITERAILWTHCLIVYQRSCIFMGQPPLALLDTAHDSDQKKWLTRTLPPALKLQLKLHAIVTRCSIAAMENGLRSMSSDQERALGILIRVFDLQIGEAESDIVSELDKLYYNIARLTVQGFSVFLSPSPAQVRAMSKLYTSACAVVEQIDRIGGTTQTLVSAPVYFTYGIMFAGTTLLRMLKGSFTQYLDVEDAKSCFFLSIDVAKRLSTQSSDLAARTADLFSQVWASSKAFKKSDGSECTSLRIRSRLVMSPVFDVVWWWREEFGGQAGAYPLSKDSSQTGPADPRANSGTVPPIGLPFNSIGAAEDNTSFLDDQLWAEFGWTFDDSQGISSAFSETVPAAP